MLNNIANTKTIGVSKFTDISNNVKEVKHSVILNDAEKRELEEKIVDELYRIFTHKAG